MDSNVIMYSWQGIGASRNGRCYKHVYPGDFFIIADIINCYMSRSITKGVMCLSYVRKHGTLAQGSRESMADIGDI